ncbi:MAG: 2-amino-4-hydroxy-6-hydroxymethyldihydropteridine diphosphokinase [Alphaproteobacteria bacterium HGW-Alphaproteobacteria-6]|nr:MAG: 2-amino-4-hydroxy-6-hydroxymethyldihydropteridine diphosphokinase [Alphaproteobacteria bacterium HGW-Alphaproteobacteria-6]
MFGWTNRKYRRDASEATGIDTVPQVWESVQKDRLVAIALGGNAASVAGGPAATLLAALAELAGLGLVPVAVSRFFRTPAFPPGAGADFVNAAALVRSAADPETILAILHRVEAGFGRERLRRWGARTLDLDLLFCDDIIAPDAATLARWTALAPARQQREAPDRLILPHPRLQDRGFVLIPLAEIAPAWRHPATGLSVRAMCDALDPAETADIRPIDPESVLVKGAPSA